MLSHSLILDKSTYGINLKKSLATSASSYHVDRIFKKLDL